MSLYKISSFGSVCLHAQVRPSPWPPPPAPPSPWLGDQPDSRVQHQLVHVFTFPQAPPCHQNCPIPGCIYSDTSSISPPPPSYLQVYSYLQIFFELNTKAKHILSY